MSHLETETKFELTPNGFDRLQSLGQISRREDQINVYYDAQWKLADSAATLRIRFNQDSDPVLTLKIPVRTAPRRVMQEFEIVLPRHYPFFRSHHPPSIDVERELPEDLGSWLLSLGVTSVERVGWVRNTRLVIEIEDVGQIELDRLQLPDGTVFHEAEIETNSEWAQNYLSTMVCRCVPDAKPSTMSKFQRFREAAMKTFSSTTHLTRYQPETVARPYNSFPP